jgi:hypothetical protein
MELLGTLFVHPLTLAGWHRAAMLLPLCLSISLVYKSIKCERLRDVPQASLVLWVTVIVGMYVVGLAMWGIYWIMT